MGKKKTNNKNDNAQASTVKAIPSKTRSEPNAPKTATSEKSNTLFWIMFILLSGGLCFGIKTYLDEEFLKINQLLSNYDNRINAAVQSQSNMEQLQSAIQSMSELQKQLGSLQEKQAFTTEEIQAVRNILAKLENHQSQRDEKLELLAQEFEAATEKNEKLENQIENDKMESFSHWNNSLLNMKSVMVSLEKEMEEFAKPIHDSQKGFSATRKDIQHLKEQIGRVEYESNQAKNSASRLEDTVKSSIEDLKQLSSTADSSSEKVSSLESTVSTLTASQIKVESSLRHYEDTTKNRFLQNEEKQRTFEQGLSDKMALLEQQSGQQLADMLSEVVEAKRRAEAADKDSKELQESLKMEFKSAVTKLANEYQHNEGKINKEADRTTKLEGEILKLQAGDNKARLEDVSNEMQGVRSKMSDVVQALRRLEDDMKQSEQKIESRLATFTDSLRKSNEELSRMRDHVTDLYVSLEEVEKSVEQNKESSNEPADQRQDNGKN